VAGASPRRALETTRCPPDRACERSRERFLDEHGWPRTTDLPRELAAKLKSRNYQGLRIHCHNMPDETHMSVSPAVLCRGLRYVFDQWQPVTT